MCSSTKSSLVKQWYPGEMVIMVEDVHKVGKELTNDAMEVEEWVTEVKVMCNQEGS